MDYWRGFMNWPLDKDWVCETCNEYGGLTWGFVHATCRCNNCHTQYSMRDENGDIIDFPISLLKDEYKTPAKEGYKKYQRPISEFTKDEWDGLLAVL